MHSLNNPVVCNATTNFNTHTNNIVKQRQQSEYELTSCDLIAQFNKHSIQFVALQLLTKVLQKLIANSN